MMKKLLIGLILLVQSGNLTYARSSTEYYHLLEETEQETPVYIVSSPFSDPVVMIVGGVHGDEVAGILAAYRAINLPIEKGTLIIVPQANKQAVQAGIRAIPGKGDLNRMFSDEMKESPLYELADVIFSLLEQYHVDILIDLHEAREFQSVSVDGIGQSVIFYPNESSIVHALSIVDTINAEIAESPHKFSLESPPIKGSLVHSAGKKLGITALTLETCEQLPLELRIQFLMRMLAIILAEQGMLNVTQAPAQ